MNDAIEIEEFKAVFSGQRKLVLGNIENILSHSEFQTKGKDGHIP